MNSGKNAWRKGILIDIKHRPELCDRGRRFRSAGLARKSGGGAYSMVAGIEGRSQLGPCAFATALHRDHEKDRLGKVTDAGRVLVITGAGVSAESGIPTFRGKDGYWRNFDPAKLATPEAFARDPKLVWEWYSERRQRIRNAQPNAAHAAIAKLARHADEFLLVTQNVDDLHARAGLPKEKMVQIHGDIFLTRCSRCDFGFTERKHDQEQEEEEENVVPRCAKCDALMRPGVVWFGEQLPWTEVQRVESYLD